MYDKIHHKKKKKNTEGKMLYNFEVLLLVLEQKYFK